MANIIRTIQKILYGVTDASAIPTPASGEAAVGVDQVTKQLYTIDDTGTRVDYGAGGGGAVAGLGFVGWDEGVVLGTGTVLNAVGDNLVATRSGSVIQLLHTNPSISFPQDNIGVLGRNQGVNLGTGTTIDWGTGMNAAITGSVIFVHPFDGGSHGNVWRKDTGTVQGVSFAGVSVDSNDVLIGNAAGLRNFKGVQNVISGSYTTVAADLGKVIKVDWATGTITIHQTAPADFNFLIIQKGAGQVVISGGASGTVRNRSGHSKIAGQYGMASVYIESNTGLAPQIYIAGDTA